MLPGLSGSITLSQVCQVFELWFIIYLFLIEISPIASKSDKKKKFQRVKAKKVIINEETVKNDKIIIEMESLKVRVNELKMMKIEYTKYKITVEDFVEKRIKNHQW